MTSKWLASSLSALAFTMVTLSSALPSPALANDDSLPSYAQQDSSNPAPGNGPDVARMSVVQGKVVVQRGDSNTQVAAALNAPLLPGDYVSTGSTARAEVQFDGYTTVRFGGGVQARITANDANSRQVQLADGTIEVAMLHEDGPIDVETPSVTVRVQNPGAYRITIGSDGSTWVTARRGSVTVVTPQHTYDLQTGKTLVARGAASSPSIAYTAEVGYDSFDQFNAERDRVQLAAISSDSNLNPSVAGYDNLSAYGQWQDVSGYGNVWVPNEPAGWAPYRNGSWTWAGGYGWTWVGSEPWGWVPYHYGRWFYNNTYGWCWYPPAVAVAPVWQPALVGFFGFGVGVGIGFGWGWGSIGWVPLAPFAPYYSWYPGWRWYGGGWGGYWGWNRGWGWGTHVTNITNITNINNYYHNNFYHGGATGTLTGNFHNGNFTHLTAVDPHQITHIGTVHGALPVTPTTNNLRFSNHEIAHTVTLSKSFSDPRFASNPGITHMTSFSQQQHDIAQGLHENTSAGSRENTSPTLHENNNSALRVNTPETSRDNTPTHDNTQTRDSAPTRENTSATLHENTSETRSNASDPWTRFNTERDGSNAEQVRTGSERTGNTGQFSRSTSSTDALRTSHANTAGSWGRFTQERGNVTAPHASYSRGYGSNYYRGQYGGYSRGGAYGGGYRGSYPSYSRGSYPSYSRGSYPSYSHGSYPSAPHQSGGGGGGGAHSGGGGGGHAGGGRPPH